MRRKLSATVLGTRHVTTALNGRQSEIITPSRTLCNGLRSIRSNCMPTSRATSSWVGSTCTNYVLPQRPVQAVSFASLRADAVLQRAHCHNSSRFDQKIWDRRKSPITGLGSRRWLSGGVKRQDQHLNPETEGTNKAQDSYPNPSESPRHSLRPTLPEQLASTRAASDAAQKHLLDRLPQIPQIHRPSKEELLAAATGFWSRLKVRFKWFSIRSARPFNADDIGAFFSWVLVGHVIWIVLGTTTFFSLAILAVNTVFAQGKSQS